MIKQKWLLIALALMLAVLTACEGTSGSVTGSRQSCKHTISGGSCKGGFRKLSGTFGEDIESETLFSGDEVRVQIEVSVESGPLRVFVKSAGNQETAITVRPGETGRLTGIAEASSDKFEVYFQALEDEATGISYQLAYKRL